MYHKVIVMEIKEEYALGMGEDGEILRIQKKEGIHVGDCIYVLDEDLYQKEASEDKNGTLVLFPGVKKEKHRTRPIWRQVVAAVAAVAIFVTSASILTKPTKAYAMVSVDGEKNIEFTVNKDHIVKNAVSGEGTISKAELEQLRGETIDEIKSHFSDSHVADHTIVVGYALYAHDSQDDRTILHENLEETFGTNNILYIGGDHEDIKEAKKQGKSLGMYLLDKALMEKDFSQITNDISEKEMYELIEKNPTIEKYPEMHEAVHQELSKYEAEEEEQDEKQESSKSEYEDEAKENDASKNEDFEEFNETSDEEQDYKVEDTSKNEYEAEDKNSENEYSENQSSFETNEEETEYESEEEND